MYMYSNLYSARPRCKEQKNACLPMFLAHNNTFACPTPLIATATSNTTGLNAKTNVDKLFQC